MALVLQTAEAVMRYFPAYVTRRKQQQQQQQQQQQHDGAAATIASSPAADAPSVAYTAAAAVSQQARRLFTDFVDTVSRMIDNMTVVIKRLRRKQRQQLLQVAQPVTQAALSLLLTAVKNRHLRGFTVFCQYIGWAAGDLLETWAPVPVHHGGQQQQQQQQAVQEPLSSPPVRLQEPHPAAAALAGRYLLAVGKSLQRLAAAGTAERSVQWLQGHLMSGDAADGQPQQPGPLRLLLRDILKVEHFIPVLNNGSSAEKGIAGASTDSSSSSSSTANDSSNSGANKSSRVEAVLTELQLRSHAGVVQPQLLRELLTTATDHWLACLEQVLSAEQYKQDLREELSDLEATLDKQQKELADVRQYAAAFPPRKRLSLRYMEGCQVKMVEGVQDLQDQLAQFEHPHEVQKMVGDFGEVLYALGEALCAQAPTRFCCNNPHCDNVATASEAFCLVHGAACVCGGCLAKSKRPTEALTFCVAARYCSPACQEAHWCWHKLKGTCRMLRQAQGTGTAAVEP